MFDNESDHTEEEVGPNDQGAPGTVFCFAYALPYTYSDLMNDLEWSKKFLLAHGGALVSNLKNRLPLTQKRVNRTNTNFMS